MNTALRALHDVLATPRPADRWAEVMECGLRVAAGEAMDDRKLKEWMRLAETPGAYGQAFNLGGAQEISIYGLAERISELINDNVDITLVPYEEAYGEGYADMRRRVPDNTKAHQVLGFVPVTGIDEIIRAVAADLKERTSVQA